MNARTVVARLLETDELDVNPEAYLSRMSAPVDPERVYRILKDGGLNVARPYPYKRGMLIALNSSDAAPVAKQLLVQHGLAHVEVGRYAIFIGESTDRYDIDDPLERPDVADYPPGFTAVRQDDPLERIEVWLDVRGSTPHRAEYRMRRHWPHYGKPGKPVEGIYGSASYGQAEKWLARKKAAFIADGWTVTP